ncbi:MAG TPA: SH3 domain-containing protein [Cellvibrio sp.]|nr:SH3 domain-containing protein [Cellvibrio sp.]
MIASFSNRRLLRRYMSGLLLMLAGIASQAQAQWFGSNWFVADEPMQVSVDDAFINLYSGPGRGYPIFHVIERDEIVTLLKSRTRWIKVKTRRGLQGWIKREDMQFTLALDGSKPEFPNSKQADYLVNRFEMGAAYGDFAGADSMTINLGYRFTKNLSVEARFADNTGSFSDSQIMTGALLFQPFPDLRGSPFFSVGAGKIKTFPSATLVQTEDREDDMLQASLGAYIHLTGRFFLRVEYVNHYVVTSRNTNEEVNEWKLGFNVFF